MIFILLTDFDPVMRPQVMQYYQASPTALDTIEAATMQQISGWIAKFYDANAAFNPLPPTPRNGLLVMYMCDIMIYHLCASMTPSNVPAIRHDRYQTAVNFFEDVMRGRATLDLPPAIATPTTQNTQNRYGNSNSDEAYF